MFRQIVILSAVASLNCASPVLAVEAPNQDRLPALSNGDMFATAGESIFHSRWMKDNCGDLHKNGDTWEDAKAQRFFFEGLFQHYFHQFTHVNYNINSINQYFVDFRTDENATGCYFSNHDKNCIKGLYEINGLPTPEILDMELPRVIVLQDALKICQWYIFIGDSLKSNSLFARLAGKFQILKVQIEKKEMELEKGSEDKKELLLKDFIDLDRKCTDCQVILFNWIKDVCDKARDELVLCYKNNQQADAIDLTIANKIASQYPEFLYRPVYQDFMNTYAKDLLPGIARSADELKNIVIANMEDMGVFEPLINIAPLVEIAKKAFGDEGSDEDLAAYTQLFQEQRPQISEILQITGAEMMNFETVLNALIFERANI